MVSSRESFITLPLAGGPRIHMGYDSKIPDVERGSYKIHHDEFMPSPTTKQIVEDEEEAEFSTWSIRIEESILEVTPSPTAPEVYEISDISSPHMDDPKETFESMFLNKNSLPIFCKNSRVILLF